MGHVSMWTLTKQILWPVLLQQIPLNRWWKRSIWGSLFDLKICSLKSKCNMLRVCNIMCLCVHCSNMLVTYSHGTTNRSSFRSTNEMIQLIKMIRIINAVQNGWVNTLHAVRRIKLFGRNTHNALDDANRNRSRSLLITMNVWIRMKSREIY